MVNLANYLKNNKSRLFFFHKRNFSFSSLAVNDQMKLNTTSRSLKSLREIPGPSSLPLLGPIHHFLPGGDFYKMNRKNVVSGLHRIYGPIVRLEKMFHNPFLVFLFDAESVGKILQSETGFPLRTNIDSLEIYRQKYKKQHTIGNLVNSSGEVWRKHRSIVNPVMLQPKVVSEAYSEVLDDIVEEAMARIKTVHKEDCTMPDIDKVLKLWALESAGAVTLGRRLDVFNRNLPENSYEKRLVSLIGTFFANLENVDFRVTPYIWPGHLKRAMKTYDELYSVMAYFLNETIKNYNTKKEDNKIKRGIVEKILSIDKNVAINTGLDSMVVGVDSVVHSLLGFWYLLGTNREKQDKLRAELLSGKNGRTYLKACMKEASRIVPTIVANVRITSKPTEIMGYEIPKGVALIFGHYDMCMMESNFPRPREFIPERWIEGIDNPLSYKNTSPFAHLPFGFGVRTCTGRRIAEMETEKMTAKMIKNFDITWTGPPPKLRISTFAVMEKPYKFVFKRV